MVIKRIFVVTGASKGIGRSPSLLSEDAGFITGQTLFVDGGGSIGRTAARSLATIVQHLSMVRSAKQRRPEWQRGMEESVA